MAPRVAGVQLPLSRISPLVTIRVSVSIVYRIATGRGEGAIPGYGRTVDHRDVMEPAKSCIGRMQISW